MKKLYILVPLILLIAGILYYPSYRAPEAHQIVHEQVNNLQASLVKQELGNLKVIDHTTNRNGSKLEVEWFINTPEQMQSKLTPTQLTFNTSVDIEFGWLPSSAGFAVAKSTTTSPDIDKFLAEQGNEEGLQINCETMPDKNDINTDCQTNEIVLKNTKNTETQPQIKAITLAPMQLGLDIRPDNTVVNAEINIPDFHIDDEKKALFALKGMSLNRQTPYDPSGKISLLDSLIGPTILDGTTLDGTTDDKLSIEELTMTGGLEEDILLKDITFTGNSKTLDGVMSSEGKAIVVTTSGLPMNISSLGYGFKFANLDVQALNDFSELMQESAVSDPTAQMITPDQIVKHSAAIMAKGPVIDSNLNVAQSNGEKLKIDSKIAFKETEPAVLEEQLQLLLAANATNPQALIPFILENMTLKIDLAIDRAMAESLSKLAAENNPAAANMTDQQQAQTAAQQLAMMEMLGVLARNDEGYTTLFEMNEKGILLNGTDISPMLGLPSR